MMPGEAQAAALARLAEPGLYPHKPSTVQRLDTHSACVFLAGDRAYKVKRAVRYSFLDYSTLEQRRLRLRVRSAPEPPHGADSVSRGRGADSRGLRHVDPERHRRADRMAGRDAALPRRRAAGPGGDGRRLFPRAGRSTGGRDRGLPRPGRAHPARRRPRHHARRPARQRTGAGRGARHAASGARRSAGRDLRHRIHVPHGVAGRAPRRRFRATTARRSPPPQHRDARRRADAVRRHRVQRCVLVHRRLVRPRLPVDGLARARTGGRVQHAVQSLPAPHERRRRPAAAAAVPGHASGGAGQDQPGERRARRRSGAPDRLRSPGPGLSGASRSGAPHPSRLG